MNKKKEIVSPEIFLGLAFEDRTSLLITNSIEKGDDDLRCITDYIIKYYKVDRESTFSKSRKEPLPTVRYWIILLAYNTGNYSHSFLADKIFNSTNHSIVTHAIRIFKGVLSVDKEYQKQYEEHIRNLEKLFIIFTPIKKKYGRKKFTTGS